MSKELFLASKSPRRKVLLNQIGIQCHSFATDIDETYPPGESPENYAIRMAKEKSQAGWKKVSTHTANSIVLGADTCIALDNNILGKPRNQQHGIRILMSLAGRSHHVLSAVAITHQQQTGYRLSKSKVTFAPLTQQQCEDYWHKNESMDKAGGYAIQGFAASFIYEISGSYSGILGLPLFETTELLHEFEYPLP